VLIQPEQATALASNNMLLSKDVPRVFADYTHVCLIERCLTAAMSLQYRVVSSLVVGDSTRDESGGSLSAADAEPVWRALGACSPADET